MAVTRHQPFQAATTPTRGRGATSLRGIKDITLILEDGSHVIFRVADELARPPDDPVALHRALVEAPAQLTFWGAQLARATRAAKIAEAHLKQDEAVVFYAYRSEFIEKLGHTFTDTLVRMRVDADEGVLDKRRQVVEAYAHADLLRAIRDGVQHRTYLLREIASRVERDQ